MLYDADRKLATPSSKSVCPICKSPMIAKCGAVNIWHWAHESLDECDTWHEPISKWHLEWQSLVNPDCREVLIGEHKADIKLSDGHVFEIQHSSMDVETMEEREQFYGNMTWIFDGAPFKKNLIFKEKNPPSGNTYYTARFKRPRKYIVGVSKLPFYIDLGDTVYQVKGINTYENTGEYRGVERDYTTYVGWGYLIEKDRHFYRSLFGADLLTSSATPNLI